MVATTCPTAEELKNYTLGHLSEQDWAAIAEHLESCRQCQAAIATVDDVADTLVTQLRDPAPGDSFLNESQCEAALKRARDIKSGTGFSPVDSGAGVSPVQPENSTGKMPVPPGVEFEGYQILEELGQGGMGAVYKALHNKLDRVVAIKILTRGRAGDQRAIARFEREMKAVGRFDHPHIVRAYDARAGGTGVPPVLIMEFVEGMDLGRLVRRLGPLPMAEACELVRQACLGLQYIHEQGLVHRDLKPSNLMLTRQGTVKILDLGLARFHFDEKMGTGSEHSEVPVPFFSELTNSGQAMGTADYMAPEQASDSHAVDIRADIYSLGCTLYKLLAGSAPFEGSQYKGTFEKMTAHVQQSAPPIENLLPEIPRELAAILEKMLAKNPADRFAQPAEVIEALTPFCTNAALPALLVKAEEAETESPLSLRERARVRADQVDGSNRPATQPTRRRTSILIAIGLLMFGLGFASGLSLGIIVMIKRGGETTTVKVPEGSNVNVNEQGDVTVDLKQDKNARIYPSSLYPASLPAPYAARALPYTVEPSPVPPIYYLPAQNLPMPAPLPRPAPAAAYTPRFAPRVDSNVKDDYKIRPGDAIWVRFKDEDGVFVVEPDGTIPAFCIVGNEPDTVISLLSNEPEENYKGPVSGWYRIKIEGLTLSVAARKIAKRNMSINPDACMDMVLHKLEKAEYPPLQKVSSGDRLHVFMKENPYDVGQSISVGVGAEGQVNFGPKIGLAIIKGLTIDEARKQLIPVFFGKTTEPDIYFGVSITYGTPNPQAGAAANADRFTQSYSQRSVPTARYTDAKKPDQKKQRYTVDMTPVPDSYRLNPGDSLVVEGGMNEIKHFGESNGGIIEVAGDGTITFDKIFSPVKVEGMTLDEAEFAAKKRIKEVCFNPEISIKLIEDEKTSVKQSDSQSHLLAKGDKVDIRISVTPDSREFHEECTIEPEAVKVDKKGYADGTWKITGLTLKEAEKKLLGILRSQMNKNSYASITLVNLKNKDRNPPESHKIDLSASDGKAAVPPEPYTIMPGDTLKISAVGTIPDQPINSFYLVEQAGTVALGPAYGRVNVKGLSLVDAEKAIQESLKKILRQPEVSVTLAAWVDRSATPSPLPDPYIIGLGDTLRISAVGTISDQPIDDLYVVEPMGTVVLPPAYGRVNVQGLKIEQAEKYIGNFLKKILREPTVSISLVLWQDPTKYTLPPQAPRIAPGDVLDIWANGTIPDQPIHDFYLVESDGQVTLGPAYGRVNLKGQTLEEAEKTVNKQLMQILREPEVSITLGGWRNGRKAAPKEDELIQKASAPRTSRARNVPSGQGVKTSDVNFTLAPPLLQPKQESLLPSIPANSLVPVLPGLPPAVRGLDSTTNAEKKSDGQNASPVPAVSPAAEFKALRGQWKVVNIEKGKDTEFTLSGYSGPNGMSIASVNRLEIGQENVSFVSFEKGNTVEWTYRVDPAARPKTIDLSSADKALGIYEMDGDILKICLVHYLPSLKTDQRPKDFTIEPGSDKVVITLQRYQPSADEKTIKGEWYIARQIEDGKAILKEGSINAFSLSFSTCYCHYENIGGGKNNIQEQIWQNSMYVLDPDKDPKTIKIYPGSYGSHQVFSQEKIGYGVYKFEDERLWIVYRIGGPAPEKLESAPGSGITLLELQKSEPKKEDKAEAKTPDKNIPADSQPKNTQEQDENNK